MKKSIKIIVVCFTSLILIGLMCYFNYNHNQEKIAKQREAIFDKFASYLYPYFADIASLSNTYVDMEISIMYDYAYTHRSLYIYDNVKYYNGNGYFSMKDLMNMEDALDYIGIIIASRVFGPIANTTESRYKERDEFYSFYHNIKDLKRVDIYNKNIEFGEIVEELMRLNGDIHTNLKNLSKYKTNFKIDLNAIKDSEYNYENY